MTATDVRVRGADPAILAWVESTVGGSIRSGRRFPRGRPSWLLEIGGSPETMLVLKSQRAPSDIMKRYRFLSEFNLQRENLSMGAVHDAGILVPRVLGFHEGPDALLINFVEGTGDLASVPAGRERTGAMEEYARTLAEVHHLDWHRMGLDATIPVPTPDTLPARHGPLGASIADFRQFRSALRHVEPLLDLAIWWLEQNSPIGREIVSLLHGDAGVNQFLVEGGRLTTVLDWELSYLGDPMWDFGNARYREVLYPSGTFGTLLSAYALHANHPLDRRTIQYYTVGACMTMLLPIAVNVHRPRVKNPDSLAQLWWDELTRALLCDALLEAIDADPLQRPDPWPEIDPSTESRTAKFLVERLAALSAALQEQDQGASLQDSLLLAEVVALEAAHGATLESETLEDLKAVIGHRPANPLEGLQAVDRLVRDDPAAHLTVLITYFGRLARRRMRLLAPLSDVDGWGNHEPVSANPAAEWTYALPELPAWI